ncbi:molybdenum cofactor biosynthesis protein MoaE [Erythrobacter sp. HL-111]|uniref:molybdenum cofactor biosynthesis protein MoaE n=1 Tax=Erythrobacter sp. HL-111 TaxID=1798193 RepID=UPI0006DB7014|nr:molybdenum cofactor biosynthesis protein MoaE [Erythrobacter sp. HL-111]KPP93363.1 MAG: molybdopterin synthase catalytic subunit MoaE [Erythrobacteraceae bacterium HL-111]SDR71873.1 molybdopterin synthase subunit MoaE [Erythrobacter sp. HL-111]
MIRARVGCGPWHPADLDRELAAAGGDAGAQASFVGRVRGDDGVEALELLHYEPLTRPAMQDMVERAARRFGVGALLVYHSLGLHTVGQPLVYVGAAATHRRSAIEAVDYCMDHLKAAAWLWKRELRRGRWRWIEPRVEDHADLARWRGKNAPV